MPVLAGDPIYAADMNRALSGGPERPLCVVRNSVALSVANASLVTPLTWNTEDVDTHGWHDTATNPSRITPLKAGWVEVNAVIHWSANATGRRGAAVKVNGAGSYYGELKVAGAASNISTVLVREFLVNGTTDYIELAGYQDSGAALNTADPGNTFLSVKWLREP